MQGDFNIVLNCGFHHGGGTLCQEMVRQVHVAIYVSRCRDVCVGVCVHVCVCVMGAWIAYNNYYINSYYFFCC